jgi:hypothetical protein
MTIDTRAYAWCNLGQLSPETPATLADSHIQGSGVVTVRGTVVLLGVVQVAAGTAVDLAYSDGQRWIARVPRRLRVLSSSINPLALGGRGETTLSVGCKLAYMEDRKPPITNPTNTEENSEVPEVERRVATPPLTAGFVVGKILTALGLTAANTIPMTIRRIVDEWDLSAGYVEELGRIVSSEGYFCRVNEAEQVEFISKNQEQGPGLLVTQQNVIELTPANVGELPGEAVLARYTSLKLVPPDADLSEDEVKKRNWESETVIGDPVQSIHTYTNDAGEQVKQYITYMPTKLFTTSYDQKDRVRTRQESSNELNGLRFSTTSFSYGTASFLADSADALSDGIGSTAGGNEDSTPRSETTQEFTPVGDYLSACGLEGPHGLFLSGNQCTMMRTTSYDRDPVSGVTRTTTRQYTAYINTPFGSDAIAKLREAGEPVSELLKEALKLVPYGSEQRIRTEREYGLQKRPGQAERTALATRKAPSVEQTAEITWAVGSSTSQTAVEMSPSYVSDDAIVKVNGVYSVQASNAEAQALNYARIENRLLLANRNGCGIQLTPLHTPPRPFDLLYVRLNGATACFRVNGTTWTIDRDGAVCTIDALFWGAIDGAVADAWFPLPPGASSLPATAAVTTNANPLPANAIAIPNSFNFTNPNLQSLFAALPSGQAPTYAAVINPAQIVRPYHETVELQGGVLVGGSVEVQTWLPTELELDGGVAIGGSVQPIDTLLEVLPAQIVLQPAPITLVSNVGIAAVEVQTAQIVLLPNPINLINLASTTELLLEMEGSGSAFVDSSINNHTVTVAGTVTQSAGLSQWGTKAAEFNGAGGAVVVGGSQFGIASTEAFSLSFYFSPGAWSADGLNGTRQVLELVNPSGNGIQIKAEPYNNQTRIYMLQGELGVSQDYRVATVPRDQLCYIKIVREINGLRRVAVNGIELFNPDTYSGPFIDTNLYDSLIVGSASAEIQAGIGIVGRVDYVKLERIGTTVTDVPIASDSDIISQAAIKLFPAQLRLQPGQVTLVDEVPINTLEVGTAQLVLQPAPITLANTGGSSTAVLLEMEGTGSTFVDTSGNNNAVSVVVTTNQTAVTQTTAQARWGSKAADFPGTGTAIVVAGTGFPIAAGDPFSVSLYVRPPVSANVRRCLLLMETNSSTWLELSLVPASNQTECYVLLEDYPFSDYRIATVPFNAWSYIKLVREASGLRRFAANGTEIPYVDSYEGEIPVYDSRAYPNGFRVGSTENQIIFNQGIVAHVDHVRLELAATSITAVPTGP